ncbi:hypothetical protein D3C87_1664670 [compost metagenome]
MFDKLIGFNIFKTNLIASFSHTGDFSPVNSKTKVLADKKDQLGRQILNCPCRVLTFDIVNSHYQITDIADEITAYKVFGIQT